MGVKGMFSLFGVLWIATFFASQRVEAFTIDVADAPTNNLRLALNAMESARETLYINIYELTSPEITQGIIKTIKRGVKVEILEEGQPVGGMKANGEEALEQIVKAMEKSNQAHRYYLMSSDKKDASRERRFRYDHAKYMVIDDETVLIGSENYSSTGNPVAGKKGNRGWQTLIHDSAMASQFKRLFAQDSNTAHGDVTQLVNSRWSGPIPFLSNTDWMNELASYTSIIQRVTLDDPKTLQAEHTHTFTSPNSSLKGLVDYMNSAKSTLDLELLSFSHKWGNTGNVSPLFNAVVAAARRGVRVRVLLNDERVFMGGGHNEIADEEVLVLDANKKTTNEITVEQFKLIARKEGLNLNAEVADVDSMGVKYIHNKGGLVDRSRTLISSINWNRNSVENNRETAVVVGGSEVNDYYQSLFDEDWSNGAK